MRQLDLFAKATMLLQEARNASEVGDLATLDEVKTLLANEDDPSAASSLAEVVARAGPFAEASALPAPARAVRLWEELENTPPNTARRTALLRAVAKALAEAGPLAEVGGVGEGSVLALLGDPRALDTMKAAYAAGPTPRRAALLGDALLRTATPVPGQRLLLDALLTAPDEVPWARLQNPDVAALPYVAEMELELEAPVAWTGPLAIVTGVLPLHAASEGEEGGPMPAQRAFVHAMRKAMGPEEGRVAARREMRGLCAPLFDAFLARR